MDIKYRSFMVALQMSLLFVFLYVSYVGFYTPETFWIMFAIDFAFISVWILVMWFLIQLEHVLLVSGVIGARKSNIYEIHDETIEKTIQESLKIGYIDNAMNGMGRKSLQTKD